MSELDSEIMNRFEANLKFVNNRYEISLMWKDEKMKVEYNRIARRRFDELNHKFDKDHELCKNYRAIVLEQENREVVEKYPYKIIENSYFMPHRPVLREDTTTNVRMVFDESSKEKHLNSFNDYLYPGPNLNPNILDVIMHFRTFSVAFCTDIDKAFVQIAITENNQNYLKFLWFSNEKANVEFFRFTRAPFRVTCSPFILAATVKHHIRKYNEHPKVVKILDSSLFVDDLITGSNSDDKAFYLSSTASTIYKEAGMNLQKFNTNSVHLRKMWEKNKLCDSRENSNNRIKVLGLLWGTVSDTLHFEMQSLPDSWKFNPIKLVAVKVMLKIFDPIGYFAPFLFE
ncbi:uncharacterized protein LOC118196880 [Stegodyphus dumicola]|uniref:uncharacterized protein LOC118196880 n=1 Tax=Stegodyphus dumicola TaxID=202533 RepID=UPI0015AEF33C|nr:uncharacterized protein LOC118196880 [Stegodyphus dumicola]